MDLLVADDVRRRIPVFLQFPTFRNGSTLDIFIIVLNSSGPLTSRPTKKWFLNGNLQYSALRTPNSALDRPQTLTLELVLCRKRKAPNRP